MCCIITLALVFGTPDAAWNQENSGHSGGPALVKAVMCESIQKLEPTNQAIVFSIDLGRVSCFTEFDKVDNQTVIHHKWYHRGNLISTIQLALKPPRWSSFSSMQLRDADKGPWHIDVTDENDKLLYTLRFSITD